MEQPPDFLCTPLKITKEETFQPNVVPRKGGIIAWMATLLVGVVVILSEVQSGQVPCMTLGLFLFFFLAAVLITFSYWVESKTIIHVTPSQLSYRSPFRRNLQNWDQIFEITASKAGHFWQVVIRGEVLFFSIKVSAKDTLKTQSASILELPQGDRLVRIICGMSDLSQMKKVEDKWICQRTP
jgi:hypothetical protein